jgi:RHS repeat-associated protein
MSAWPLNLTAAACFQISAFEKNMNGNAIRFIRSVVGATGRSPLREISKEYSEITDWGQIFQDFHPQGWYGYIKDQVGTIYKVWDHNAHQVADNRNYDSFGNLISQTGTTKTPLGFQGKYYDQESGLNYFYHRYYNPTLGRFISEDPIGINSGVNMYRFVRQNPINQTDSFGLKDGCPQDCQKLYWNCLNNWFLPGLGDVFQGLFNTSGYYMHYVAWHYAAEKGLIVPLRSSVFRPWYYAGGKIGPTFFALYFASGTWFCLMKEIECLMNQ